MAKTRRALITGFGPFPGVPRNPSGVLALAIARSPRWKRLGWRLDGEMFPTDYRVVEGRIDDLAEHPPRFVVMLGVAARSKRLRVELVAQNRSSLTARDASGKAVKRRALEPGGPMLRHGRHGGMALVRDLRAGGVPARISRDTGRYVCNASYWWMLRAMPARTRVVFVHIPLPGRAGQRRVQPRPTMPAMERAITRLVLGEIGRIRRR